MCIYVLKEKRTVPYVVPVAFSRLVFGKGEEGEVRGTYDLSRSIVGSHPSSILGGGGPFTTVKSWTL